MARFKGPLGIKGSRLDLLWYTECTSKKAYIFAPAMNSPLETLFQSVSGPHWSAGAELMSLMLFARANTLWRSKGMISSPLAMLIIRSTVALALVCALTALQGMPLPGWGTWSALECWTVLLGMFGGWGLLLFATSLSQLPSRLVFFGGTVHLFFGAAMGYFVLGEEIGLVRGVVMVCLLIGQAALGWKDRETWLALPPIQRWIPFAIGFVWGTYYPFVGIVQTEHGVWNTLVLTEYGVFLTMAGAFLLNRRRQWAGLTVARHYREMGEQAVLSLMGQSFSALCIAWGGVVLHSILTNFSTIVNVSAFRLRFGERIDWRYMGFFLAYGSLMLLMAYS